MEVRKHNARKITETFEYEKPFITYSKGKAIVAPDAEKRLTADIKGEHRSLKGFKIAGEDGKISLTFDERDKQQVVDLLRAMADSLDDKEKESQKLEALRLLLKIHNIEGHETATFDDWDIQFKDGKSIPIKVRKAGEEMEARYIPSDAKSWGDKS